MSSRKCELIVDDNRFFGQVRWLFHGTSRTAA
jgi:hypothetical protein